MNRRTPRGHSAGGMLNPLQIGLTHADELIAREQFAEAARVLIELDQQFPDQVEVLSRLMNLAVAVDDLSAILRAVEPLARLRPNDPEIALNLAVAWLKMRHLALAQQSFASFAERWPSHPKAADAHQQAHELSTMLGVLWREYGLADPPDLVLMARNEEMQNLVSRGAFQEAVQLAEQALRRHPDFIAMRNNLSLAYQNLGKIDEAIAATQDVLTRDPHNLHALGNMTRFLVLAGKLDQATLLAEQLKSVPTTSIDIALKQAEALSFFGDDEGVLVAFEHVQKLKDRDDDTFASAMLHHLAAVASMRQGRIQAARRRWQKALDLHPGLELAAANLADLKLPEDKRHAPWPYGIAYWLQRSLIEELMREISTRKPRSDAALSQIAQRFLQRHPALKTLVPLLLDRGDPAARQFALRLADMARTPELLNALADFALSQRGPTDDRMHAAQLAQQSGVIANGMVRFWQSGAWHETMMLGIELHGEPIVHGLSPAIIALQQQAAAAQRAGDIAKAELLLNRALNQAPNAPSLLNNLGAVYGAQGRSAEAEALARRIVVEHPDYIFGCTNMVSYLIQEGKLDEAQALIEPLLRRTRMHVGEFGALAGAQCSILLAQGNPKAAEGWLNMWEQADADHPLIPAYRSKLRAAARAKRPKKR